MRDMSCYNICSSKQVNPRAKVSVKLVGEAGIGTVASGVAKANADIIQVINEDLPVAFTSTIGISFPVIFSCVNIMIVMSKPKYNIFRIIGFTFMAMLFFN